MSQTLIEKSCQEGSPLGVVATDRVWESAIVIQGPYFPTKTENSIRVFLERNDSTVLVVVSTYLPVEESEGTRPVGSFLSKFERDIVLGRHSESPHIGRLVYLFVRQPDLEISPDFWGKNTGQNLHRLSTFVGLRYVESLRIPLVLKCRSDSFFGISNINRMLYEKYTIGFPLFLPQNSTIDPLKLKARIAVTDHSKADCTFHKTCFAGKYFIGDFWYFGYTSDIIEFFKIGMNSKWDDGRGIRPDEDPETNFTDCWMREVGIPSSTAGARELAARYFAVPSSVETEFVIQKLNRYEDYLRLGVECIEKCIKYYHESFCCVYLSNQLWLKDVDYLREQQTVS